jgi:hypothetical protein
MPQSIEIFVRRTRTRIILVCAGLALALMTMPAVSWAVEHPPSDAATPAMLFFALICALMSAYVGAITVTIGVWGGFPAGSRHFVPGGFRNAIRNLALTAAQQRHARTSPITQIPDDWVAEDEAAWLNTMPPFAQGPYDGVAQDDDTWTVDFAKAEEQALCYMASCDTLGERYDWNSLSINIKAHFPDLAPVDCKKIALIALEKKPGK